ncbi:MAG: oligosaccharide flippase family protein [bacterium]
MKQSRLTGAVSLVAAQAVVLSLGYVTHLWIGRALGPASYGIFGIVLSLQTIAGMVLTFGIPMGVSRFVAQNEQHARSILRQALRLQTVAALIVALATVIAAPFLSRLLGDVSLIDFIRFVSLIVLLQAFYQVYIQFLSGMHHFNKQAALTSIYAVTKLAGAISLIYIIGVYGAFAGFAVGGVIAAVLGWYWTRRMGGADSLRLPLKLFLSFAGTYVFILIGLQILISLDLFMVKALLKDDVLAGYYNASVTLARIPYLLLHGLAFILLPSVSALTRPGASRDRAAAFIRDTLRYLIAIIVPGVALAAATSKSLVILFYSSDYFSSAAPLTILMVGLGALAFFLLLSNIIAGAGRAGVGLIMTIIILALSAVLGWLLIPRFGLIGAAWQTTISSLVGLTMISIYTFRALRIPVPLRSTINILIATAIAIIPTYLWQASPLTLIPQYLFVFALYLLALYTLGEIKPADRARLARLRPKL